MPLLSAPGRAWPVPVALALVLAAGCPARSKPAVVAPPPPAPPPVVEVAPTPPPEGRLGDQVTPTGYQLELEIDPGESWFRGRVAISLAIAAPTRTLWLNGVALEIRRALLRPARGGEIALTELPAPEGSELVGFDLGRTVAAGSATLEIEYNGPVGERIGVFHQQSAGAWYAFTDFEPTDARRALPCFDDPRFKVPWQLSLVVPNQLAGYANTPEISSEAVDLGHRRLRFAPTRPLPSYLIAFAVGPFAVVEVPDTPVPVRILVPRDDAAQAARAAAITPPLLAALVDYFSTPVPFPKVDLVSVPEFEGAMENPGLITVSEKILLTDRPTPTLANRRLRAMVIAHELSHLWIGDLVTLAYWDDTWINEGFATFLADHVVAGWAGAADLDWDLAVVIAKQSAMEVDERLGGRAVHQPIAKPADIAAAFDAISYKKGGAVLAMVEALIGADAFRRGVIAYVHDHTDGSATSADLVAALSAAAGRDLGPIIDSFVDQPGIPLVDLASRCEGGRGQITLHQSRYLALAEAARATAADRDLRWHIPLCLRYGQKRGVAPQTACTLLDAATATVELPVCPAWVYPNAGERGYFRFAPTADQLAALARAPLARTERLGLVDDLGAGLHSGAIELPDAVAALPDLAGAATSLPATTALIGLVTDLNNAVVRPAGRARFAALIRRTWGARARKLGFRAPPGEDGETARLRPLLVELVGQVGRDPRLIVEARRLTRRWLDARSDDRAEGDEPASELSKTAVVIAAAGGDRALYRRLRVALLAARPRDRVPMIFGLAAFTRPELVKDALALALSGSLDPRNAFLLLDRVIANPRTRELGYAAVVGPGGLLDGDRSFGPAPTTYFAAYSLRYACSEPRWREIAERVENDLSPLDRDRVHAMLADLRGEVDRCIALRARYQDAAAALFEPK